MLVDRDGIAQWKVRQTSLTFSQSATAFVSLSGKIRMNSTVNVG